MSAETFKSEGGENDPDLEGVVDGLGGFSASIPLENKPMFVLFLTFIIIVVMFFSRSNLYEWM